MDTFCDVFDAKDAEAKFPEVNKEYDHIFDPKHHKKELEVRKLILDDESHTVDEFGP